MCNGEKFAGFHLYDSSNLTLKEGPGGDSFDLIVPVDPKSYANGRQCDLACDVEEVVS